MDHQWGKYPYWIKDSPKIQILTQTSVRDTTYSPKTIIFLNNFELTQLTFDERHNECSSYWWSEKLDWGNHKGEWYGGGDASAEIQN